MTKFQTSSNKSSLINFPTIRPSLDLDFANSKTLDPRITFTRSSGGSFVGPDGLIKYAGVNQPRFDHDPATGESLGLMIEELRSNLHMLSIPSSGTWTSSNTDITSNSIISPDGTQNASLVKGLTAGFEQRYINLNSSIILGQTYTQTFFVKAGTTNYVQIAPSTGFDSNYANFELIGNGRVCINNVSSAFIQAFPNGWYRIGVTETATSTVSGRMLLCVGDSPTNGRLPNTTPYSFYVWGAQLELGEFSTSYIPAVGSTRTRAADTASMTGTKFSSWYNQSEGTAYVKFIGKGSSSGNLAGVSFDNNTGNEIIQLRRITTNDRPNLVVMNDGIVQLSIQLIAGFRSGSSGSIAASFATNKFFVSFITGSASVNKGILPTPTQLTIGNGPAANIINGTISRLTYYPKRLPDSQLQALTK